MEQNFFKEMFEMMTTMSSGTGMGTNMLNNQDSLGNLTEQQKEAMIKMWLLSGKNCLLMAYPFGYPTMAKTFLEPILWLNKITNILSSEEISDVYLLLAIAEKAGKEIVLFMPVDVSGAVKQVKRRMGELAGEKSKE